MQRRVVVVGSGAAGSAAALAACKAGAHVTVVRGGVGATSLTSGALDGSLGAPALSADVKGVIEALGIYTLEACTLATSAGILRAAAGRDRGLCDLAASAGAVLVARVAHPGWDADALARSYAELDKTRDYVVRDIGLVVHPAERAMAHAELAALHDDDARLGLAAERIRAVLAEGSFRTVLLPPWLGVIAPRAAALSKLVGVPCGEVLTPLDGPCGARFERARDRCFAATAIETVPGRVKQIEARSRDDAPKYVALVEARRIEADVVIVATGGLLGGGLAYTPGAAATFTLTYGAAVAIGHDGHPLVVPGSVFGAPPESLVWPHEDSPLSERVGVLTREGLRAGDDIYAAGDAVADAPRTLLAAFASGTAAGRASA